MKGLKQSHGKAIFAQVFQTKALETIGLQGLLQNLTNRTKVRASGERFGGAAEIRGIGHDLTAASAGPEKPGKLRIMKLLHADNDSDNQGEQDRQQELFVQDEREACE